MDPHDNLSKSISVKAQIDESFRERLNTSPHATIEAEFGVTIDPEHEIVVHEDAYSTTHLALPPRNKYTKEERDEARTGAESLAFLQKTMSDPAPPMRMVEPSEGLSTKRRSSAQSLVAAGREGVERGLEFIESQLDENGAWHCIRFNTANADVPRHYERPAFISAFCMLAIRCSTHERAKRICARTKRYLTQTIEFPGLWRYYRHLPTDLDSSTLCSLALDTHPWVAFRRNEAAMLANRDENGCFTTWVLADDEPPVVAPFRIEADPVVNANVIAYLGDCPETQDAQAWLAQSIVDGTVAGASKWYPDVVSAYYALSRAMLRSAPLFTNLRSTLVTKVLDLRDANGEFADVLQAAQAVSSLYNIESLKYLDTLQQLGSILDQQRDDGSWPELLAFGDQAASFGTIGQIGHGSESVTTAFCIEALERLGEMIDE